MGYHLKRNEYWGIEVPSGGFMTKLFFTRKEAMDFLKEEKFPPRYRKARVKLTEIKP